MDIIVNAMPLTGLQTGISRYVRCLYSQLQTFSDVSVAYFDGSKNLSAMPLPAESVSWAKKTEMVWQLPDVIVTGMRSLHWLNFERKLLKLCGKKTFNIYHETAFVPAAIKEVPVVYTMNDISLIKYCAEHPRERVWFYNLFFKRRLPYASHILTISEFMRNEIIETLGIHEDAITAVPLAPDLHFYPRDKSKTIKILEQNGWPQEYILFVGTLEPRKNISLLIKALSIMKIKIPLVLAGWKGWGAKEWCNDIIKLGLDKRIIVTDYVDDETIACLYSGASALIYPSIYEGFGLPVIEAMACGCPVICSHAASLPEVAGDAAVLIDPTDAEGLAHVLDTLLNDSSLKQSLIERGLQRSRLFTWGKTANQTLNVFEKTAISFNNS